MSSYCVTGAGVSGANGQYDEDVPHSAYQEYNHSSGSDFRLVYTGYYELRSGANPWVTPATSDTGYYYDNAGSGGSYEGLDTLNTDGVLPIPTVTAGACNVDGGNNSTSTSTFSHDEGLFIIMVLIVLLALPLWRFIFSGWSNKR